MEFRNVVRNRVLEQKQKDELLLLACDTARKNLSTCGITVKVNNYYYYYYYIRNKIIHHITFKCKLFVFVGS